MLLEFTLGLQLVDGKSLGFSSGSSGGFSLLHESHLHLQSFGMLGSHEGFVGSDSLRCSGLDGHNHLLLGMVDGLDSLDVMHHLFVHNNFLHDLLGGSFLGSDVLHSLFVGNNLLHVFDDLFHDSLDVLGLGYFLDVLHSFFDDDGLLHVFDDLLEVLDGDLLDRFFMGNLLGYVLVNNVLNHLLMNYNPLHMLLGGGLFVGNRLHSLLMDDNLFDSLFRSNMLHSLLFVDGDLLDVLFGGRFLVRDGLYHFFVDNYFLYGLFVNLLFEDGFLYGVLESDLLKVLFEGSDLS